MTREELENKIDELESIYLENTKNFQSISKLYGFYMSLVVKKKVYGITSILLAALSLFFGGCYLVGSPITSIYVILATLGSLVYNVIMTGKVKNQILENNVNKETLTSIKENMDHYLKNRKNDMNVIRELKDKLSDLEDSDINMNSISYDNNTNTNTNNKVKTLIKRK